MAVTEGDLVDFADTTNLRSVDYVTEATSKSAYFTFGRFNPPTIGHHKLLLNVKKLVRQSRGR